MVLEGYWLGLTGPMGPLPSHLTEYADYERRYGEQRPFGRLLDLLADRMLQFYLSRLGRIRSPPRASTGRRTTGSATISPRCPAQRRACPTMRCSRRGRGCITPISTPPAAALAVSRTRWGICCASRCACWSFSRAGATYRNEDQSRLGRQFATLGGDMMVGARVRTASDSFPRGGARQLHPRI